MTMRLKTAFGIRLQATFVAQSFTNVLHYSNKPPSIFKSGIRSEQVTSEG